MVAEVLRPVVLRASPERAIGVGALVVAGLGPLLFNDYWVSFILTQTFLLGIAAASLIFLSAYGGMVSLAQTAVYGIAGFALGNAVTAGETNGLNLAWHPWVGVLLGIGIATAIALLLGAVACRSTGIYFLMLTLTFSVIANYFFGQVALLSGFGGVSNIDSHLPGLIGRPEAHPNRLYYTALIVAFAAYFLIRYVLRTPFGITLQGIRDDPIRMSSLGYNVTLHRLLAFGFAGFIASLSGVLFVWWNGHVDPQTIGLQAVLNLLIIAVIGGLFRLEGAWLGAFVFIVINNYVRDVQLPVLKGTFNTVIGLIFLAIVLLSPGGLMGFWESARRLVGRPPGGAGPGSRRTQSQASTGSPVGEGG
jgi:branched-chain amino acid transport system permease protein